MGFTRKKNINFLMVVLGIFSLLATSCVDMASLGQSSSGQSRTKKTSNGSGGSGGSGPGTPSEPIFNNQDIDWFNATDKLDAILSLNESFSSIITLRGSSIHDFLGRNNNFNKQFCLVVSYNGSAFKKNLRLRAAPINFLNFAKGQYERILRIDFNDRDINTAVCTGTAFQINTNLSTAATVADGDSAFLLNEVCTTCTGTIVSTNVSLYESDSGISTSNRIDDNELSLNKFTVRIDTSSTIIDDVGGSCSQSACQAKGANYCCLSGQCVRDGDLKPGAETLPEYDQAMADVDDDPNNFKFWKNIFFVCGSTPPPVEPEPEPVPDPEELADIILQDKLKEYYCLEEGKKETPDFATANVCEPSFDQTSYESVRATVWAKCGCNAVPFPTDPDDPRCPDFGLKLVQDVSGKITDVVCDNPAPPTPVPEPFQELQLDIPARTAPHRFYRSDNGESVDINLSKKVFYNLPDGVTAEGSFFSYIDEVNKKEPDSGSFNMNAIMGQFTVELDQAIPAQTVDVEFNTNYIISTTPQGFFTPCAECNKDYWFESFTAWPSSVSGMGVSATRATMGYSTSRTDFNSNTILANYEDNIFGRACFVPPTMIPFSHKKNADLTTQRQARLATQAALFANGYQRDWYGFNKGALIGSFDGVRWFAIGGSRRVTSSSKKLYLAVNAPFADLAERSSITVQITENNSNTNAADFDYDPNLSPNDPNQNSGATCQHFHSCSSDSDCVSKLGWEYMCENTTMYKSVWPVFDTNGNELVNDENPAIKFSKLLQGGLASGSKNRCVYRGSGSVCKKDFSTLDDNKRRLFTCAPNFYCADLDENAFNREVAREPKEEGVFQLGREANVLGRPLNYVGGGHGLSQAIIDNIKHNAALFDADVDDFGICRPGKQLADTYANQHQAKDNSLRTDYINQISSCNSEATGDTRVRTCPIFEDQEDQAVNKGDYIFTADLTKAHSQNMCGQESQYNDGTTDRNTFEFLELGALNSLSSIDKDIKVLAQDACFRRAGSICHTDLDCSPNKLHAEKAESFGRTRFGGTDAEKEFWEEALICGQAAEKPTIQDPEYFNYDMTQNRCCRAVGNDFTMYTQDDDSIITDHSKVNTGLSVATFPFSDPTAAGRYSRYAGVSGVDGNPAADPNTVINQVPIVNDNSASKAFQWKTLNETGKKNCCGGGWIRKFADGSKDWSVNRFNPDITKFACLNYQSEIPFSTPDHVDNDNYIQDIGRLCRAPADNGCVQESMPLPTDRSVTNPTALATTTATLSTRPLDDNNADLILLSSEVPYNPIPFINSQPINQDLDDLDNRYTFFPNPTSYIAVSFYLPIYIGYIDTDTDGDGDGAADTSPNNGINDYFDTPRGGTRFTNDDAASGATNNLIDVRIRYFFEDTNGIVTDAGTSTPTFVQNCDMRSSNPRNLLADNEWCIEERDGHTVFHAKALPTGDLGPELGGNDWTFAFIEIDYNIQNRDDYIYNTLATDTDQSGMKAGNALYYLTKLGRFELTGVPQIWYEPIYCNSNKSKLVEGLFDLPNQTRTAFEAAAYANNNAAVNGRQTYEVYDAANTADSEANPGDFVVQEDSLATEPIFKSSEFRCCVKLNQKTSSSDKCCSGYSVTSGDDKICKLPKGTNVNVYFNKFISSEGMDDGDFPEDLVGLTDDDFIAETGEIKLNETAYSKLANLGAQFCENGAVRNGGAFGFFFGEPFATYVQVGDFEASFRYGILDNQNTSIDYDDLNDTGTPVFNAGFKWDHHLYCE
jgi:hypothetical protein